MTNEQKKVLWVMVCEAVLLGTAVALAAFCLYNVRLSLHEVRQVRGFVESHGRAEEPACPEPDSTERRDRFCAQTCKALKFRTLMSARDGDEAVCRCATPRGVLHVRDDGEQRTVLNDEAEREDNYRARRLRELEAAACASGSLSQFECGHSGLPWRGGR
jgi:hypothetical protein